MYYPPALRATIGPGVVDLLAAAETLRECATDYLNLSPQHWEAPSAVAYRDRVRDLSDSVQLAAGQVDSALAAARHHADQLAYVRQALAAGAPVPM